MEASDLHELCLDGDVKVVAECLTTWGTLPGDLLPSLVVWGLQSPRFDGHVPTMLLDVQKLDTSQPIAAVAHSQLFQNSNNNLAIGDESEYSDVQQKCRIIKYFRAVCRWWRDNVSYEHYRSKLANVSLPTVDMIWPYQSTLLTPSLAMWFATLPLQHLYIAYIDATQHINNYLETTADALPSTLQKLEISNDGELEFSIMPMCLRRLPQLRYLYMGRSLAEADQEDMDAQQWLAELSNLRWFGSYSDIYAPPLPLQNCALEVLDLRADRVDTDSVNRELTQFFVTGSPCSMSLRELHLRNNGCDAHELTTVPDCIQQLRALERLCLCHHDFRELPEWLGSLPRLQVLDVSGNRQLDTLPRSLRSSTTIRLIDVADTCLGTALWQLRYKRAPMQQLLSEQCSNYTNYSKNRASELYELSTSTPQLRFRLLAGDRTSRYGPSIEDPKHGSFWHMKSERSIQHICGELGLLRLMQQLRSLWWAGIARSIAAKRAAARARAAGLIAAFNGDVPRLQRLHETAPGCLTATSPYGRVPSHYAAEQGHLGAFRFIQEVEPPSINHADNNGWTPIHIAVWPRTPHGRSTRESSLEGRMGVIRFIAEVAPAIINQAANNGITPMMCAAAKGLLDVLRLIQKVAGPESVNHTDCTDCAPLHWAAYNNQVPAIKTLLELRGDPSLVTNDGLTPLAVAQQHNRHGVCDCLQSWLQMSGEQRTVIITYGWDYFEMPTWHPSIHSRFPAPSPPNPTRPLQLPQQPHPRRGTRYRVVTS